MIGHLRDVSISRGCFPEGKRRGAGDAGGCSRERRFVSDSRETREGIDGPEGDLSGSLTQAAVAVSRGLPRRADRWRHRRRDRQLSSRCGCRCRRCGLYRNYQPPPATQFEVACLRIFIPHFRSRSSQCQRFFGYEPVAADSWTLAPAPELVKAA